MIRKDLIFVGEQCSNEISVLSTLINKAYILILLNNKEDYLEAVLKREKEFSTAIGFKIATPHGMGDCVNQAFIAFLKTDHPILWGDEKKEVEMIFLIGIPENKRNIMHLKFISQISKSLMREEFRNHLLNCNNQEEAWNYLDEINKNIEKELNH